jgi:hypothetical protein
MDQLKALFQFYRNYHKEYLRINGSYIRKNINLDLFEMERFEPHPYIPIQASNYGRIKYLDKILEQKIIKDGYIYVNVPYEIKKIMDESDENILPKNNMSTPIVEEAVEYEKTDRYYDKDWKWHPCIQIGICNNSKIINAYEYKYRNKNENYGKCFKEKTNTGINNRRASSAVFFTP